MFPLKCHANSHEQSFKLYNYLELLNTMVKSWLEKMASGRPYFWRQAPSFILGKTQKWFSDVWRESNYTLIALLWIIIRQIALRVTTRTTLLIDSIRQVFEIPWRLYQISEYYLLIVLIFMSLFYFFNKIIFY